MNLTELYAFLNGGWSKTEIVADGDNQTIYQGKLGSPTGTDSDPVWCIKRTTITVSGDTQTIVEKFADSNMKFDNVWDDREDLIYGFLA